MATRLLPMLVLLFAAAAVANEYDRPTRVVVQRGADGGSVQDCYIWQESPNSNGNGTTLYTGLVGTTDKVTLLQFDLSGVPDGADILGAQVLLHATGGGGQRVTAHHITAPWTESEPTWATFGTAFEAEDVGAFTPVATGPALMDVTGAVQQWVSGTKPNNGLMLRQVTLTASSTYAGSEVAAASQRPMLELWYELKSPLVHSTPSAALEASCAVQLRYGLSAHAPAATSFTTTGPTGLELNEATGEVTWTPTRAQAGEHTLTVTLKDNAGRQAELPVTVKVTCTEPLTVGCAAVPGPGLAAAALLLLALFRRRR